MHNSAVFWYFSAFLNIKTIKIKLLFPKNCIFVDFFVRGAYNIYITWLTEESLYDNISAQKSAF